ncbi:MAG: S41 family peptidase [Gemmatimonadota bacterium]
MHRSGSHWLSTPPRLRTQVALATGLTLLLAGCAGRTGAPVTAQTAAPATAAPTAGAACQSPAAATGSLAGTPVTDPLVTFDSAWAIVARTHWDTTYNGVNWRGVRDELRPKAAAARTTGELRVVLSDMVGRLKQSHFSIIPRESSDGATASTASASASAGRTPGTTGMTLRLVDGSLLVTAVDPDSRAALAGVKPGWTLEAVGGCALAPRLSAIPADVDPRRRALLGYSIGAGVLAGAAGDTVRAVFRDGANAPRALAIVRGPERGTIAKFGNLPPLPSHLEFERVKQGDRTVGVIRFNIWMPVLAPQFDAAIDSLRDADAIVLDIRGNFGGVGIMAAGFGGHFVDSARTIGTMHQRSGPMKFIANPRTVDTRARPVAPFSGPLAVVVDELSISTSEIFAAGIKDLGRGRIFGTQTAGQALPSVPERLPNGDILYHAIADFTSPSGKPVEGDGVRPDVVSPVTRKALLEGKDPALDAAVAWAAASATAKRKAFPQ